MSWQCPLQAVWLDIWAVKQKREEVIKMVIKVIKGGKPLTETERNTIRGIFQESSCPNESLQNSLEGFVSFDGQVLHINHEDGDKHAYPEDMEV